jgi:HupE / UreJ protein
MTLRACLFLLLALSALPAAAHKPSDSYLVVTVAGDSVRGQWDIALRDLDFAIGLDSNGNGEITWGEVRARHAEIDAYALARLTIALDGAACRPRMTEHLIDNHTDGAYSVLRFEASCAKPGAVLTMGYSLFSDLDPQHKGLLRLEYDGITRTAIFGPAAAQQRFELKKPDRVTQFFDYGREGVWHIWIGFDHILFLLSLLLPAVLVFVHRHWRAVERFKPAFWDVFRIVTAFTIAHSITLSLAALGVISLPTRLTESAIALSVVLAALNNIFPLFQRRRWMVAFGFGLIHGFGFASVLADLGLPRDALLLALVGFNLGVEAGQLAIVAVFLPLAFALRRSWFYQRLVLIGGSALICLLALTWFIERAFNLKVLRF